YGAPSGAQCANPNAASCTARTPAIVNYIEYTVDGRNYITYRNDWLHDEQGQRTGFKAAYYETAVSWTHWIGNVITIRPEIRYEHSFGADAYDNPTATLGQGKKNQLMFASDVIFHF
ncbi:MAG: hypothetical protein JO218_14545, partial [Burkholderiales bacterium]|nr:hypothetical protein [Burkholderiales bacterium]